MEIADRAQNTRHVQDTDFTRGLDESERQRELPFNAKSLVRWIPVANALSIVFLIAREGSHAVKSWFETNSRRD